MAAHCTLCLLPDLLNNTEEFLKTINKATKSLKTLTSTHLKLSLNENDFMFNPISTQNQTFFFPVIDNISVQFRCNATKRNSKHVDRAQQASTKAIKINRPLAFCPDFKTINSCWEVSGLSGKEIFSGDGGAKGRSAHRLHGYIFYTGRHSCLQMLTWRFNECCAVEIRFRVWCYLRFLRVVL